MAKKEITEAAKTIMDFMGCECEFVPAGKSVKTITKMYNKLVEESEKGGYTPIVVSASDILAEYLSGIREELGEGKTPADYRNELLSAKPADSKKWLSKSIRLMSESGMLDEDEYSDLSDDMYDDEDEENENHEFSFGSDDDDLILAKIPTTRPWEVFAWVPFGGWNECPPPDMMMAVCKHWYEKYGAVPATISHDTLEFSAKPVNSKQAKQLAREHCAFCPEIILQGGYIGEVIDELTKSTVWFFWWD